MNYQDDEYELSGTSTHTSEDQESNLLSYDHDYHYDDPQSHLFPGQNVSSVVNPAVTARFASLAPAWLRKPHRQRRVWVRAKRRERCCSCSPRFLLRKFALFIYLLFTTIFILLAVGAIFFPGYTHLPAHYQALREQALASDSPGRVNLQNQKVFIAASIYDKGGKLCSGDWAQNVLDLIQLLGPKNAFLSIYVNDSGPEAKKALENLRQRVPCDHELVFEDHLELDELPHITTPDGSQRVKRIEYLAEVRNRALRPLEISNTTFDKLLYLNDVVFHPIDAAQLLFSTHTVAEGTTDYRAACAVDFINAFKFYDTFATRDMDGYSMGLPFFPWFSANGDERTHQDILDGKDAVRVRSCWGGMVAFDARFFQKRPGQDVEPVTAGNQSPGNLTVPYRFRAEKDLYWDASECCLIQADIQSPEPGHSGIYSNPFVRVAYDSKTLSLLGFTRRFERLYTPVHFLLDILTGAPGYNPRRYEVPWQEVEETIWIPDEKSEDGGSFQQVTRIATHSGFCGRQSLQVMKENITEGERNWEFLPVPS
ncbi:uncharacterized protein Z518_02684 [Rhinocladiella mackenziei CBS 650.93]|uniref:Glycosyltransferase family 69 protein n=1 Tax=Rhinocladiella mackenziei CBS 650.93 TaxID=1442369 RepID=A0A0D2IQ77_9EURO|nr:uncharacterized protein Z518_02684 [Rhinocladiella mackenziei CBS 650.93]KIX08029.1 hypothetical protein Z518_02684 [Rhinocladiella mackenziei CBS 650.93]